MICIPASHAWNRGRHPVSGALAYSELVKSSPQKIDAAIAILQAHPSYAHWQKEISDSEGVDQRKALFMLAAAWLDDVRRGQFKRFDHPDWHYVNFAFTPGQPLTDVLQTEPFQGQLLGLTLQPDALQGRQSQ